MQSPVVIGQLPVHRFGSSGPIVVAVHGITANGLTFAELSGVLAGQVWAPDLRGRADARDLPGPWGISRHADDVVEVLEHAVAHQGSPVVLTGHSMGAFVAAAVAARRPDLVSRLVLIDGGVAFPPPAGTTADDVDAMIHAVIGPAMARLSMTFADDQAYLDFWAAHPALGALVTEESERGAGVRRYLLHDLVPAGAGWVSSCVRDAIVQDGSEVLTDAATHAATRAALAAGVPTTLIWAARGLLDQAQGLYDRGRLEALQLPSELRVIAVDDVNHYTVLFAPTALGQVRAALQD